MGLLSSERGDLSKIWAWTIVLALAFAALGVAGQTTPSTQTPILPAVQEKPTPDTSPTVEDTRALDNPVDDGEIQRRFNDLRRQLLDDRADTINWWLTIALIVLAIISIGAALGVYFGLSGLRAIKDEAKKSAEEVKKSAEEINELKKQVEEDAQQIEQEREQITRAAAGYGFERRYHLPIDLGDSARDDEPLFIPLGQVQESDRVQEAAEAVQEVRRNPEASPMDRAIADAYSLQRAGRIDDAIEKWRSIANVTEGSDPDLAARAWLSVGYLLYERGVEDAGE